MSLKYSSGWPHIAYIAIFNYHIHNLVAPEDCDHQWETETMVALATLAS